ncbi:DUF932 domain-containing protein [Rhizobiales bacterium RZME27]|uniref:DUF932 domain-containing protein n=1 Tax=Endobacterium cereale TaxID=2663029 RepID=A0A6A8A5G9_9HYPH|nr:DUF932 domain-containing protein [Endobacterium cereale]MEB2846776.1 DUF932 domain-containing protein [Endobacterium cereale]MQY46505.1 DUF932 domain-containing protein [Endobacterium cereale]
MTVYTETARFDTGRALTETEMRRIAPSIFAVTAHESRSERFMPIPTIEVLRGLIREGFMPVGAKQSRSRTEGKADFTKHLIRMRRVDYGKIYNVGDTVCEILLKNANDGTSAYELMAGLFRIRCLNSLVTQTGTIDAIKVRHSGDVQAKVIEGTYRVLGEAERTLAAPQDWATMRLNRDEKDILADAAHVLRFGDTEGEVKTPIKADRLLVPRRHDDRDNDLWTVWNVVQENAIKGGLRGVGRDDLGRPRRVSSRAVNGIDQDIKLNKALWLLGERMAALKS